MSSDQLGTHVISAIINVGQDVEEDWPLYIKDNRGQEHTVMMEPGDMVWYESARKVSTLQKWCKRGLQFLSPVKKNKAKSL